MDDIYKENIIDHYQNPRNFGDLPEADPSAGSGQVVRVKEANASCGDMLQLALKWHMANGVWQVEDVKFKSIGCAISTAAGSLLTEKIKAIKVIEVIKKLNEKDMIEMLGIEISPTRMKCAMLPLRALGRALEEI